LLVAAGVALAVRENQCRLRLASLAGEALQQGVNGDVGEGNS